VTERQPFDQFASLGAVLNECAKLPFNGSFEAAECHFLQPIGDDRDKNLTPESGIWGTQEEALPESAEGLAVHLRQGRKLLIQRWL
jgi:hypothetical protein